MKRLSVLLSHLRLINIYFLTSCYRALWYLPRLITFTHLTLADYLLAWPRFLLLCQPCIGTIWVLAEYERDSEWQWVKGEEATCTWISDKQCFDFTRLHLFKKWDETGGQGIHAKCVPRSYMGGFPFNLVIWICNVLVMEKMFEKTRGTSSNIQDQMCSGDICMQAHRYRNPTVHYTPSLPL